MAEGLPEPRWPVAASLRRLSWVLLVGIESQREALSAPVGQAEEREADQSRKAEGEHTVALNDTERLRACQTQVIAERRAVEEVLDPGSVFLARVNGDLQVISMPSDVDAVVGKARPGKAIPSGAGSLEGLERG